jgi:error-prone DNA polymerase
MSAPIPSRLPQSLSLHDLPDHAELFCLSNYSFLCGASHPEELVQRAAQLGYRALALTDECSLAGVVRAHVAQRQLEEGADLQLLIGSHFRVQDESGGEVFTLVVLACNLNGYGNLSEFITRLRRASPKGQYRLPLSLLQGEALADCVVLAVPPREATDAALQALASVLLRHFMGRCWWGVVLLRQIDDELWLQRLRALSEASAIPLVACGEVHFHVRSRKPLQDVLTAIRVGRPLTECGWALQANAERHLRTRLRLAQIYPPDLLAQTLVVAGHCQFSLAELRYQYPDEFIPAGESAPAYLRRLTWEGAQRRWPEGASERVRALIEHELALIDDLHYEHYFLTVADIVQFARSRGILCQGRGSAANSVVCFCLGITEVDPARLTTLFERFISKERNEPPDIDVDFEHERREEVIQYLYAKYGRERAALTAAVISYQPRSALREVGKALGFSPEALDALARAHRGREHHGPDAQSTQEAGFVTDGLAVQQLLHLATELQGFPRHLSQHTGGFVLTGDRLSRLVPIENASMPERTVIQWDKDDLDALGLMKVDVLALGMLSALRKALDRVSIRLGRPLCLADIPEGDADTYDMTCRADTVGVFQIESRAQMSMLPRLRPRCYYDLVIEVALVRPGPIQGGAVHPYLNRRQGLEPVVYPSEALKLALERTLGVPVFQEQCMQIAMLAAGFTPGEADGLRRAMAAWKRKGGLQKYEHRLVEGMVERGYERAFAQGVFEQIKGFSDYGFPESHAASFALLVYASAWLKSHFPAEFLVALLNSQPMGFYSPSQLVQDARRHGVEVRPVDVQCSDWDSTLEGAEPGTPDAPGPAPAVRLGLRLVGGLSAASAQRIVQARHPEGDAAPCLPCLFADVQDLARRAGLEQHELRQLAAGDALRSLAGHRRQQMWEAAGLRRAPTLLRGAPVHESPLHLPTAPEGEEIVADYQSTGLTLRRHPLSLLRPLLVRRRPLTAEALREVPHGRYVRHIGLVTLRQRPGTAHGTLFISLEDETGVVQAICWPSVFERFRRVLLEARLLQLQGQWQREGEVANLIVGHAEDLTSLLGRLAGAARSRDFH